MATESQPAIKFDHNIANGVVESVKTFKTLLEHLSCSENHALTDTTPAQWKEEYGRLRTWSANIGAHQRGTSSLDFRLRDASHVSEPIVHFLKTLKSLLDDTILLLEGPEPDAPEDEDDFDLNLDLGNDKSELFVLFESVTKRIDCLFEMSLSIRKPASIDRMAVVRQQLQGSFQSDDLRRVKDLFPHADPKLRENLAAAVTVRRGILRYYDQRQQNYARGAASAFDDSKSQAPTSMFPATEYAPDNLTALSPAPANGSRAMSVKSNRSLASLMDETKAFHISLPPELKLRQPYACPHCHYMLDIFNSRDFVRHVLDDITPYQCIYADCQHSQELLASRSAWIQHLQKSHPVSWKATSEQPCIMCTQPVGDGESMEKHLSRHLEEVALDVITVPDIVEETVAADDDGTVHSTESRSWKTLDEIVRRLSKLEAILDKAEQSSDSETVNNKFYMAEIKFLDEALLQFSVGPHNIDSDLELVQLESRIVRCRARIPDQVRKEWMSTKNAPDAVLLRIKSELYQVEFSPFAIAEETVRVGYIRATAAQIIGLKDSDRSRVRLIYKDRELKRDNAPIRQYGCKQHSTIEGVLLDDSSSPELAETDGATEAGSNDGVEPLSVTVEQDTLSTEENMSQRNRPISGKVQIEGQSFVMMGDIHDTSRSGEVIVDQEQEYEFQRRMRERLAEAGYSEEDIERLMDTEQQDQSEQDSVSIAEDDDEQPKQASRDRPKAVIVHHDTPQSDPPRTKDASQSRWK